MITPKVTENKVVFGPCRLSYCHVLTPQASSGDATPKYSTAVLIPKSEKETLAAIKKAMEAAKQQGLARNKWGGKLPAKLASPVHDGDAERAEDENYAGHYYLNASCKTRPGVIDKDGSPITDEDEIYSGAWAYVSVSFFAYDTSGNRGIGCGLNNLKKYKDDERFGGRSSAASDFDGVGDDAEGDDMDLL